MVTATKAFPWDHFLSEKEKLAVESWRMGNWSNIKRELGKVVELPAGLEPCWVAPGRAVFWQQQNDETFAPLFDVVANSHQAIAYQLNKGLLLRPPGQEVVEEEAAVPLDEPTQIEEEYVCRRHGRRQFVSRGWKAYINHTVRYQEEAEYDLPDHIKERAKQYAYYCPVHNQGWQRAKWAKQHFSTEKKKPGIVRHPTVQAMKIKEEPNA